MAGWAKAVPKLPSILLTRMLSHAAASERSLDQEQTFVPLGVFLQPRQMGDRGRNIGQARSGGLLQRQLATRDLVTQDQGHRVPGVGGFGLVGAVSG